MPHLDCDIDLQVYQPILYTSLSLSIVCPNSEFVACALRRAAGHYCSLILYTSHGTKHDEHSLAGMNAYKRLVGFH
jgi:hypothetical protein